VLANTNTKLALTGAALGATAYARTLGQKMMNAGDVPVAGGTAPDRDHAARGRQGAEAAQGAAVGHPGPDRRDPHLLALHEEQQRTTEVFKGTVKGLPGTVGKAAGGAAAVVGGAAGAAKHKLQDVV
jgi:hypothetical protein